MTVSPKFKMEDSNFFAGSNLDRQAEKRTDDRYIQSLLHEDGTQIMLLFTLNPVVQVFSREDGAEYYTILFIKFANVMQLLQMAEMNLDDFAKKLGDDGKLIFLGSKDSNSYFALDVSDFDCRLFENGPLKQSKVLKSRTELLQLNKVEAALVAQSRSLLDWNKRYRFCPTCGSTTCSVDAGYKRNCPNNGCLSNKGELCS